MRVKPLEEIDDFDDLFFLLLRALAVVAEGVKFMWAHRRASAAYLRWRLGTLYGSFAPDGSDRPLRELLACLWRDRRATVHYLLWRREMRRAAP